MKKFMFLLSVVLMMISTSLFSQRENLTNLKTGEFSVDSIYVGVFSLPTIEGKKISPTGTLRAGAAISWKPKKWFSAKGMAYFEANTVASISGNVLAYAEFKPTYWMAIDAGYIPTVLSEVKFSPLSQQGQIEKWTEKQIVSILPGIKFRVPTSEEFEAQFGVFMEGDGKYCVQLGLGGGSPKEEDDVWLSGYGNISHIGDSVMEGGGAAFKIHVKPFDFTCLFHVAGETDYASLLLTLRLDEIFHQAPFLEGVEFSTETSKNTGISRKNVFREYNEILKKFEFGSNGKIPIKGIIGISYEVYSKEIGLKMGISL